MIPPERRSRLITIEDYAMKRDKIYPNDWELVRENAVKLLGKVNSFLYEFFPEINFYVRSGWRPLVINAITPGAATKSWHIVGRAIDIADNGGFLHASLKPEEKPEQAEGLRKRGLFMEHPDSTPFWIHLDDGERPDRPSRVFKIK